MMDIIRRRALCVCVCANMWEWNEAGVRVCIIMFWDDVPVFGPDLHTGEKYKNLHM